MRVAVLLLLITCSACALPGQTSSPFAASQEGDRKITLHVQNLNFTEATLWAVSRSQRQRLGVIGGNSTTVYTLTWPNPEPLQIEMDFLAGPRCMTEAMPVDPGDILELQIDANYNRMAYCK